MSTILYADEMAWFAWAWMMLMLSYRSTSMDLESLCDSWESAYGETMEAYLDLKKLCGMS